MICRAAQNVWCAILLIGRLCQGDRRRLQTQNSRLLVGWVQEESLCTHMGIPIGENCFEIVVIITQPWIYTTRTPFLNTEPKDSGCQYDN